MEAGLSRRGHGLLDKDGLKGTVVGTGAGNIGGAARRDLVDKVGLYCVVTVIAHQPQGCKAFHRHLRVAVDAAEVHHRHDQDSLVGCRMAGKGAAWV